LQSEFLELANPTFDLRTLTAQRRRDTHAHTPISLVSLMALHMREVLVIQPPLAPNERLPRRFLINHPDPALSAKRLPNYFYANEINLFVHPAHRAMYDLITEELADKNYSTTHGTNTTVRYGCAGPLCRRIRNVSRYAASRLREARTDQTPYTHQQMMADRYASLQRCQPIYAAVEPLLEAFTLYTHATKPPESPNQLSEIYLRLTIDQAVRHHWLLRMYPDAVAQSSTISNTSGVS
jgi:hypothetical protein